MRHSTGIAELSTIVVVTEQCEVPAVEAFNKRMLAVAKFALGGAGLLLVAGWFWVSYLTAIAPTAPRPGTGNVIRFNNHGSTVYVTKAEKMAVSGIPVGFALLILTATFLKRHTARKTLVPQSTLDR
jgi:hypothetical protein